MTPGGIADAIVVAAGGSSRMHGVDKLAAQVGGRPVLAWTLEAVVAARAIDRVVVVTAAERLDAIRSASWLPDAVAAVVPGGAHRGASVEAGLDALDGLDRVGEDGEGDRPVLVHDGARPLVSSTLVDAVALAAERHGAAIPVVPLSETLKRVVDGRVVETVDRSALVAAQTPQGMRRSLLREAFGRFPASGPARFTDEAALLEACTIAVHVIDGEPGNLKVTHPADLGRAAALLGAPMRTGIGHDSHPFGPGGPLLLGGIEIPGAPRLHGHSDGDVVLHAVCDALLGAAGLGDLGRLYPAGPVTPRGIASHEMLLEVVERVRAAGFAPASLDVTVVAARPRLASRLDQMRDALAGWLTVAPATLNLKASTGNLDGMEGAGRGISALVVATLRQTP